MQRIDNFNLENGDTPRTMYKRLARFAKEFGSVFAESQLVKIYLSKIDILLFNFTLPMIIIGLWWSDNICRGIHHCGVM